MLRQTFAALAVVACAASVQAKEYYGKHFIDYMHGQEMADSDYLKQLVAEREAAVAAGENVDLLTIHLVPHTHDDIGWLKTIDGYYTGVDQGVAIANVNMILDTVIAQLLVDETKVFTYVEMKFFSMWFYRQTEARQEQVRQLVRDKRLEFVNAGWAMHDEACTHFDDMINNMMIGHEFLLKEFDYKPTIGWHIDPFGHSSANPRLFAEMGFDTFMFGRLDYEDRDQRLADKTMQFVWKPFAESLGDSVEIFTHILQDMYWFPPDMGYDERDYGPYVSQPIIDDETLETFNADLKAGRMLEYALHMSTHYRTKNLFMPWGEDFAYGNAFSDFKNGDNLLRYWNKTMSHLGIQMQYSTIPGYIEAVKAEEITWPTKYDDMFPYADWEDQYWTGYFTSRANSKSQVRFGQQNLLASEKLFTGKALDQSVRDEELEQIADARYTMFDSMGSYQHHDAVTGTAKQAVADDYSYLLSKSMDTSNAVFEKHIADYTEKFAGIVSDSWDMCSVRNGTYTSCPVAADTEEFAVTSYNPASVAVETQTFKVPPSSDYDVSVYDYGSDSWLEAESTLLCYEYLENDAEQSSYQDCNLHVAAEAKPHHMTFMKVKASDAESEETTTSDASTISTTKASLTYNGQSDAGASTFTYEADGQSYDFDFNLQYYNPSAGNFPNKCASGAYLFVPEILDQQSHAYSEFKSIETHAGKLASEFAIIYADTDNVSVYQALIRLGEGSEPIEFEVQMLEIPLIDDKGREVVAKWSFADFDNEETFYTDSNGLEMQKRVRDYRPDFTLDTKMTVNDNYYPINSAIAMRDTARNLQVTVMNQHSQGGGVIETGSIELMQNRRLLHDDNKGVTDPLNEMQADGRGIAVNTKYFLTFTDLATQTSTQRKTQLLTDEPLQFFYTTDFSEKTTQAENTAQVVYHKSLLASQIEDFKGDLKLLQFPEARNQVLLRLENLSDLFDGTPAETATFDVQAYALSLYSSANGGAAPAGVEITERTLTNNQDMASMKQSKFKWKSEDGGADARLAQPYPEDPSETVIALQPQRIRLFKITYTPDAEQVLVQ